LGKVSDSPQQRADGLRVPGGRSACSLRTVRYSRLSLEVLFAFSDGPRRRAGRSAMSVRTVRGSRPDGPRDPCGRSAPPGRTVRPTWPDGPPEPVCFVHWFDSSLPSFVLPRVLQGIVPKTRGWSITSLS
jgi:hypothetical protein